MRTLPTTMIRLLTPFAPLFSKRVKETDRMSETEAKITIGALIGGAVGAPDRLGARLNVYSR